MHLLDSRGEVWKSFIVLVPSLGAALIAGSRIMDARHHPFDVITGSLLGIFCAWTAYRQYFPTISDYKAKGRAYPIVSSIKSNLCPKANMFYSEPGGASARNTRDITAKSNTWTQSLFARDQTLSRLDLKQPEQELRDPPRQAAMSSETRFILHRANANKTLQCVVHLLRCILQNEQPTLRLQCPVYPLEATNRKFRAPILSCEQEVGDIYHEMIGTSPTRRIVKTSSCNRRIHCRGHQGQHTTTEPKPILSKDRTRRTQPRR